MTQMPQPKDPQNSYTAVYDAWNRLTKLQNPSTVAIYFYDGLRRRVMRQEGTTTKIYYYNQKWQCVEERDGANVALYDKHYVWHPHYVDALATSYDSGDTKQFYLQDALFNVTAVTDAAGTVVERYAYDSYGKATYLNRLLQENDPRNAVDNEYLFTGRRVDPETRLQINR